MLKIRNLHRSFGDRKVISGLDLDLEPKNIYSLMGTNGAGKTTLFNILTGFLKAEDGSILYKDNSIYNISPVKINHMGITRTFQDLRLIMGLSVKENILLAFKGNKGENILQSILPLKLIKEQNEAFDQRANEIINQVFLESEIKSKASDLSYGQQKLLTLGCCLANDAELLLLDEPVAGINQEYRDKIVQILSNLRNNGKTILLIEHHAEFIEAVSDNIYFMSKGKIKAFETYKKLKNDNEVQEAYL